jgi:hypothetical protein
MFGKNAIVVHTDVVRFAGSTYASVKILTSNFLWPPVTPS